jgi:hypothetical protein
VKNNGTTIGTITVSTGGVVTFATTGTTVACAAGDLITIIAPSTVDTTIADFGATLIAARQT